MNNGTVGRRKEDNLSVGIMKTPGYQSNTGNKNVGEKSISHFYNAFVLQVSNCFQIKREPKN